jgi:hypothetical protein
LGVRQKGYPSLGAVQTVEARADTPQRAATWAVPPLMVERLTLPARAIASMASL